MSKAPRRLGRGLSSLISMPEETSQLQPNRAEGQESPPGNTGSVQLPADRIRPNPRQPRQHFSATQLQSLAHSIAQTGLIQPILVRAAADGFFEILAGERRWKAASMAGLTEIPAIVREATDEEMLEIALVENIFREDLNAIDRATAYRRYCDEFTLSADQVAQRVGEDRTTVTNYLRLLELPDEVKEWVVDGKLTMGHARCLLALPGPTARIQAAREAIEKEFSVRQIEKNVRDRLAARPQSADGKGKESEKRPLIRQLEEAFEQALGTRVEIIESRRKGKGKIIIHYADLDAFDWIAKDLGVDIGKVQ